MHEMVRNVQRKKFCALRQRFIVKSKADVAASEYEEENTELRLEPEQKNYSNYEEQIQDSSIKEFYKGSPNKDIFEE